MTKTQTIDLLRSQLPGFYSVEQVINLIEKLDDTPTVTPEVAKRIEDNIISALEQHPSIVDEDSIELEFGHNGRTIEVSNVQIDYDALRDLIAGEFKSLIAPDEE